MNWMEILLQEWIIFLCFMKWKITVILGFKESSVGNKFHEKNDTLYCRYF